MGQDIHKEIYKPPSRVKQPQLREINLLPMNQSRIIRNKNKSKPHLPPIPSFFLSSTSLSAPLPPPHQQCRGMGSWGLQSVHIRVVSAAPSSSCSSPAPRCSPAHGKQSFPAFSSVDLLHGVKVFRSKLLQLGSPRRGPMGSQVLPENLLQLQHGLLSTGCRSYQEPAPSCSPQGHSFLQGKSCSVDIHCTMDLHGLQGNLMSSFCTGLSV